ncbi:DUF3368 domain-containing protein [Nostoc sp. CHAB 5844]|nr:DUF3368 domain-containing protein [Nostoc sp. CHAB 5844]
MFSTCVIGAGYDRRQRYLRPLQSCPCQSSLVARSLIPQVQPVMDALTNQAGFRVSPQLYQRVLALAQEP